MNFSNWMTGLDDSVKLVDVIMPGSHNAGCRNMLPLAECQSGDLAQQALCGVRHFCIRLDSHPLTKKTVFAHSVIMGKPLEKDIENLGKFLEQNPGEFIILDICGYGDERFGPYTHKCKADMSSVGTILEKYLQSSINALIDFNDISSVTIGEIRKSGKRFLIINGDESIPYSRNCPYLNPWTPERHGKKAETFANRCTEVFDQNEKCGIFVLQTQQTGGFGTEIGLASPRKLNSSFGPYFDIIVNNIRNNSDYLKKANILLGDYWADNPERVKKVLSLNVDKGNISIDKIEEFKKML